MFILRVSLPVTISAVELSLSAQRSPGVFNAVSRVVRRSLDVATEGRRCSEDVELSLRCFII